MRRLKGASGLAGAALAAVFTFATLSTTGPASAQAIQCSTFLHNRDGSWTSFWNARVLVSYGPIVIHAGERFRLGDGRAKDDIVRILDGLCESP